MIVKVFTAFPDFFSGVFCSLVKKGIASKLIEIFVIDIKDYGYGKHKKIDDSPFGGGSGMILRPDVIADAIDDNIHGLKPKILITSPRGDIFTQSHALRFRPEESLFIVTNRYEGVDQRVIEYYKMEEISIGNFILMGGEIAATAIIEATVRLLPDVLGNKESTVNETNVTKGYIQHDHFTRPAAWRGIEPPHVLQNGNHAKIEEWRRLNSEERLRKK